MIWKRKHGWSWRRIALEALPDRLAAIVCILTDTPLTWANCAHGNQSPHALMGGMHFGCLERTAAGDLYCRWGEERGYDEQGGAIEPYPVE